MKVELSRKELVTLYDMLSEACLSTPPGALTYSEVRSSRAKVREVLCDEGNIGSTLTVDVGRVEESVVDEFFKTQEKLINDLKEKIKVADERFERRKPFSMNDTRLK